MAALLGSSSWLKVSCGGIVGPVSVATSVAGAVSGVLTASVPVVTSGAVATSAPGVTMSDALVTRSCVEVTASGAPGWPMSTAVLVPLDEQPPDTVVTSVSTSVAGNVGCSL